MKALLRQGFRVLTGLAGKGADVLHSHRARRGRTVKARGVLPMVQARLGLPWELMPGPLAVIDVETTGLSAASARVVEIAVLRIDPGGRLTLLDTLIDPGERVDATWIHGITDNDVSGAPRFDEVVPLLQRLVDGATMVAHNASFEARFLGAELARVGGRWQGNQLCTMRLARRVLGDAPGSGRHTLAALTHRFGLNNPAPHRALGDAYVTLRLFEMLVSVAADRAVPWAPRRTTSSAMLWPAAPVDPPRLKPRAPIPLRW